ncbi:hypothetical protein [Hankyongella ginsenosidimutans]|nr:hypothetical protein [Hankyongella ginsenosidimutans]
MRSARTAPTPALDHAELDFLAEQPVQQMGQLGQHVRDVEPLGAQGLLA